MKAKKMWSFAGLLMMCMFITLPFYSADVLAVSLRITTNSGEDNYDGYINAESDVWTVEAEIVDPPKDVNPEEVSINIGSNKAYFDSCSTSDLGAKCEYISPLTDGVSARDYNFQVVYDYIGSNGLEEQVSKGGIVKADGDAPVVSAFNIWQENGNVQLRFKVKEEAPGIGIKKISIIDAESGALLQEIAGFDLGVTDYDYLEDQFNGILQTELKGEGRRFFQVKAEDWFGHQGVSNKLPLMTDFVAPEIDNEFNLTSLGRFIGEVDVGTDLIVDVIENGYSLNMLAYSDQIDFGSQREADCDEDSFEEGLWHCTWKNIIVNPRSSVSINFVAEDESGNIAEKSLSKSLTVDKSAPVISFFGTDSIFEGKYYINKGNNKLILQISDQGAGIDKENIKLNLGKFGGATAVPDECIDQEGMLTCLWERTSSVETDQTILLNFVKLEDNVGNKVQYPGLELIGDNFLPRVKNVEIYGVTESNVKDYFQSRDQLYIKLNVTEAHGLLMLVDMNKVMNDAELTYPASVDNLGKAGWASFREDSCVRDGEAWQCELLTDKVKSGPIASAMIRVEVYDTAGNLAESYPTTVKNGKSINSYGDITFNLRGLDEETDPDLWSVARVGAVGGEKMFIDMDTTELTPTRMAFDVKLLPEGNIKGLSVDLAGCLPEETFEYHNRELMINNFIIGEAKELNPIIIVEMAPFNSREYFKAGTEERFYEGILKYTCQLRIYSLKGSEALRNAELQEVKLEIPFGFTEVGSKDENLQERINYLKKDWTFKAGKVIDKIAEVLTWIKYITDLIGIISTIDEIVNIVSATTKDLGNAAENSAFLASASPSLAAMCGNGQAAMQPQWGWVEKVQIPAKILSCSPDKDQLGAYGWWQKSVLDFYNFFSGRKFVGFTAGSLYDNFYLSLVGLCIPGMIYNLQKLHQINCRRIICYQNEVPQGIATMHSCEKMHSLLVCEFFTGPFFSMFLGVWDQLLNLLKAFLTNPLGWVRFAIETGSCAALCFSPETPGAALNACKVGSVLVKIGDIVETIIGAVQNPPTVQGDPYCGQIKSGSSTERNVEEVPIGDGTGVGEVPIEDDTSVEEVGLEG